LGESGTGKEVAARLCHSRSSRKDGPFVAINCAALPANLVEAELFGSVKGAFTGATEGRPGAFARADGGTLLLDEIGELPLAVQAALLRVLESGEVQVVGGGTRQVDARIIAATHVDLEAACLAGRFRLDLLHRVAVTGATLPPLRLRDGDPSLLLEEMLDCPLPPGMAKAVNAHPWPGNARQLRNLARRVRLLCPRGAVSRQQLTASMSKQPTGAPRPVATGQSPDQRLVLVREAVAREATVGRAWRSTGLPRSTFYRYLQRARGAQRRGPGTLARRGKGRNVSVFDDFGAAVSVETASLLRTTTGIQT
jgi:transcriptional regulator with PAS, ATPase and Fis domain